MQKFVGAGPVSAHASKIDYKNKEEQMKMNKIVETVERERERERELHF